jgi:hypothetical protein
MHGKLHCTADLFGNYTPRMAEFFMALISGFRMRKVQNRE